MNRIARQASVVAAFVALTGSAFANPTMGTIAAGELPQLADGPVIPSHTRADVRAQFNGAKSAVTIPAGEALMSTEQAFVSQNSRTAVKAEATRSFAAGELLAVVNSAAISAY